MALVLAGCTFKRRPSDRGGGISLGAATVAGDGLLWLGYAEEMLGALGRMRLFSLPVIWEAGCA